MTSPPAILHLIGYPAAGKLESCPPTVWDRVDEVRDALMRSIEALSPPEWSFIFTNVLLDHDPADRAVIDRLAQLARNRSSRYVPDHVDRFD